jgi:hypothetical protein
VANEIRSADGSVRKGRNVAAADLPPLGLAGTELTFIRVDHTVLLQFGDAQVQIETPFDLDDGRHRSRLDPGERAALGPVLAIYPASLVSAAVDASLDLHLVFEGGVSLHIPQHPHYESWHILGPGARQIHCPPAGNETVAVFD